MTFTKRQRTALGSCYWLPCPACGKRVPLLRGVGSAAAGFDQLHEPDCSQRSRKAKPRAS